MVVKKEKPPMLHYRRVFDKKHLSTNVSLEGSSQRSMLPKIAQKKEEDDILRFTSFRPAP